MFSESVKRAGIDVRVLRPCVCSEQDSCFLWKCLAGFQPSWHFRHRRVDFKAGLLKLFPFMTLLFALEFKSNFNLKTINCMCVWAYMAHV